jgi:hypothetical protein
MVRLAGTDWLKWDCVKSKPLALLKVMVSVEATFSPTLAGENASVTVGETGVTVSGVGHAVAAVPADDGAVLLVTPVAATATVAVSVFIAESVTVKVNVPAVPLNTTVTCGEAAPDWIVTPPVRVQLYETTLSGTLGVTPTLQAATLPLASIVAGLPTDKVVGAAMAAMGFCAALTALKALIMPAPHWLPSLGQAHSAVPFEALQTGTPLGGAGNGVALALIREISCGGVKFALTARISAATPETIGAEKLVPKLKLV